MAEILRAVCVGDVHLDALNKYNHVFRLQQGGPTYNDIVCAEIQKVYDYAERNGIEHVWFLGDIAERPRLSQEAHERWNRSMLSPRRKNFRTRGIIGNHDFEDIGFHSMQAFQACLDSGQFPNTSWYYGVPHIETIDGIEVGFLPYPHANGPRKKKDTKPRVYLGHFDVAGAKRDNGRPIEEGVGDDVLVPDDYWVIGHIHTYQTPRANVILPGTSYQLNFGESLPKGFLDITFKYEGGKLLKKYEWIQNEPLFKLLNVAINTPSDFDQIEESPHLLYKLFVRKGIDIPPTLMRSRPNIVNNLQFKDDGELVEVMQQEINIEVGDSGAVTFNEREELGTMLTRRGLTEAQIQRGFEMLNNAKALTGDSE